MAGRHRELVEELRRALGYARGAARAAATDAERQAAQAHADAEATAVRERHAGERLRAENAERRAGVDRRCAADLADVGAALGGLAAEHAAGAAGAPWPGWRPAQPERGTLPGLYRIGRLRLGPPQADPPHPDGPAPTGSGAPQLAGAPGTAWPAWSTGQAGRPRPDDGPPALVSLLDQSHLVVLDPARRAADVQALVSTVLLRVLGSTPPGSVRLTVYDPEHLGGSLASFAPLAAAGLLTFVGPGGLTGVLDELVEQIRRINETVLAGEYRSVRELAASTGRRPEPWRVAVLLGDEAAGGAELTDTQRAQLDRVVRTGPACGVHLVMSGLGPAQEWTDHPRTEAVVLSEDGCWTTLTGDAFPVDLDPAPSAELVTGTCRAIAERVAAGPEPAVFSDLLPDRLWAASSAERLVAPVGEGPDGRLVEVELGDAPPHALIGGPSGAGKTNLLYAWIGALTARYDPSELALYLLDFKEGVSFARFAPGRRDPTWLPHVRLVGVNVNSDREYGLALLAFLHGELRRRAEAAKAHEATKLSELREQDPDGRWPRIVAIIDEFQVLLAGRDPVALEAARLLEDLARRGRSQGIHLVLASQDLSGIDALWGRASVVAQFTLRIALPKARRLLAADNPAADLIPRHHAVVNPDSGAEPANRVARIPDAGRRGTLDTLQERLWRQRPAGLPEPVLFDGDRVPRLREAPDFAALAPPAPGAAGAPVAMLGQTIDVTGAAATVRMGRSPGRNLAVLGGRGEEACDVLAAAALSLARQYRPGQARFSVVCLDDDAVDATKLLLDTLRADGHEVSWYDRDDVRALLRSAADEVRAGHDGTGPAGPAVPHFLVLYAVDAASTLLDRPPAAATAAAPAAGAARTAADLRGQLAARRTGTATGERGTGRDDLRELVAHGPELHTHVIGWWRSVPRLKDDMGGLGARLDGFGCWLALDVQGSELAPLSATPGGPAWYPRPRRALYFDRAVHQRPQVIIPYRTGETP